MPELDGFELAAMIREHPRFQQTAIIFISAIQLTDIDRLRGYEMGAVDYVPVPVIPEVLRAKVRVFAELYRKTRQLEQLNRQLEQRVAERTAELEASTVRLRESEQRRSLALAAGQMGSWDWDIMTGDCQWDEGQYRIFGVDPQTFEVTALAVRSIIHPDDLRRSKSWSQPRRRATRSATRRVRIIRRRRDPLVHRHAAAMTADGRGRPRQRRHHRHHRAQAGRGAADAAGARGRPSRQERAGAGAIDREADRGDNVKAYVQSVEGRINALARVHTVLSLSSWQGAEIKRLVDEELAPYSTAIRSRCPVPRCNCVPQPRRRWRWRCTNS